MSLMSPLWLGVTALLSLLLAYVSVGALRRWAEQRQLVDRPNERSSHTRPTPRGGGAAIVIVVLVGAAIGWFFNRAWPASAFWTWWLGAALVAAISWLDDLRSLSNRLRFGVHALATLLVLWGVGFWHVISLPLLGELHLGWLALPITLLWIIGLTNIYNFMDGIDGLAGGQAVISGISWLWVGMVSELWWVALIGLLLAAASGGFLGHNWPPAAIFMGDVGSAFLGFTFAVLAVMGNPANPKLALVGVVVLWPFIFDASLTLLRRLCKGENIFQAHRSHFYQRLVIAGQSHQTVTRLYLGLALASAALAGLWLLLPQVGAWLLLAWLVSSPIVLWLYVRKVERTRHQHPYPAASLPSSEPS
jgi:UDP-N-acetylmuramyl pentapeptide phosphotransferase/UDP-N-acetylglucosamine-1-phosphate transferase